MAEKQDIQDELCTAEETALINQLVAFTKARFIYPETNQRVSASREAFLDGLRKFLEDRPSLEISARRDHLRTAGGRIEGPGALLEWFRDCMEKSALRSIRFEREVTAESLLEFVNLLHDNAYRQERNASFKTLWPHELQGIRLREQEFLGGYHADGIDEVLDEGSVRAALDSPGQASQTARFLSSFEFTGEMRECLGRIQKLVSMRGLKDTPEVSVNLINELVEAMPAEVLENPESSQRLVEEALKECESMISRMLLGAENVAFDQLQQSLRQLAGRFFRPHPHSEKKDSDPGCDSEEGNSRNRPERRAAGDTRTEDWEDEDALIEIVGRMPSGEPRVKHDDSEMQGEVMHVCLRRLSVSTREGAVSAVCSKIGAILEKPGPEALWVLDQYVLKALDPGHNRLDTREVHNVMEQLGSHGMLPLLRICGSLSRDKIVENFPNGFLYFLDSIQGGREAEMRELLDAIRRIGDTRIRRAEPTLMKADGLLRDDRLRKLFAFGGRELLPLARLCARSSDRAAWSRVARFLKELDLDSVEAMPLRIVEPVEQLPAGYLENLCTSEIEGRSDPKLHDYAGFLLRSYVESLADDEARGDRRAYAILALQKFPGRETEDFVRRLMKGKGPLGMIRPPKAVREALKLVQAKIGGKGA